MESLILPEACLAQSSSPDGGGRPPWFVWECLLFVIFTQLTLGGGVEAFNQLLPLLLFAR